MRTTTSIDDDVLEQLKDQARREDAPLTRVLNRTLRAGLQAARTRPRTRRRYREKARGMGQPRMDLRKALALAAGIEDEETARKLALRK